MKSAVVIADDLTGAADTGVGFTRAGLTVTVVFSAEESLPGDVLVYTTESRYVGESEARKRIHSLIPRIKEAGFIYKKIDSTLRGYPGAELGEIVAGLGVEKLLVAPAFPAQGRTTVAGKQYINGIPLERTSFQGEVANSDLTCLFRDCGRPIQSVSLNRLRSHPSRLQALFSSPGPALIIGDAETDLDLQILAGAAIQSGLRLFCGSAGLAAALADHFPKQLPALERPPFRRQEGPVLAIAGSRNPVTVDQVIAARDAGVWVVELPPDLECVHAQPPQWVIDAVSPGLSRGQDLLLTTSRSVDAPCGPRGVAERLAQCAAYFASRHEIGGLVLTGGDVAMAVISGLSASGVKLWGEISSGIPLGSLVGGVSPDLAVITKAGGFGGKDALRIAIHSLKPEAGL